MNKNIKESKDSKLKVIWFFLKPYKRSLIVLVSMALLVGVLEFVNLAVFYQLLNFGLDIDSKQSNVIISLIEKITTVIPIQDSFISTCIVFLIVAISASTVRFINAIFRAYFTVKVVKSNKEKIFKKYLNSDYQYFIDNKQGELIYRITTAPSHLTALFLSLAVLLSDITLAISIFALLFTLSWKGAIVIIIIGIGYYLLTKHISSKISYNTGTERYKACEEENVILNEAISGIRHVKVYKIENGWIKKFDNAIGRYFYYFRKDELWRAVPPLSLDLCVYSFIVIAAIFLKIQYSHNFIFMLPIFGTFGLAVFRLMPHFSSLGSIRLGIMASLPNAELVYSELNKRSDTIEKGDREFQSLKSNIQFENVHFSHKRRPELLKGISITFERSKTTAIVGSSGAGKSTIVDLLLRLFDVNEGEIKIDGVNLREYKLSSWLNRIGFVSQDSFVYNATIRDNITFGADNYTDEYIVEAAEVANAHDFIMQFHEGYDTLVGDRGVKLSGGEMQRIAIARALIRDPDIVILDEATSSLDYKSEALVQNAIIELLKERTVIVVAHRLSTIINADKIVVLENGKIVEEGTHNELMGKRGVYWNLYEAQKYEQE